VSPQPLAGLASPVAPRAGLTPIEQAREPAAVRNGPAAVQKAYRSALAFEQVLVEQLAKSLAANTSAGGEESEGESGAAEAGQLSATLPQALAAGVMNAGGLGMAAQMAQQAQTSAAKPTTAAVAPAAGGTGTPASVAPATSPVTGGTGA
jgi:hypothetical protein